MTIIDSQDEGSRREPNDRGHDRILRAAVKRDFPVNILCWGNVDAGTALIDRHPDTRFIIDHLAILQPRTPPAPPQPWADLPKVLDLAKRKNARSSGLSSKTDLKTKAD
jgi:L-fuconolactonase